MSMTKILLISGSPRKGNTEYILLEVKRGLRKAGYQAELILLRKKKIRECLGCLSCQEDKTCPLESRNDEMSKLNQKLIESAYIIIGSPTYFNMVSGLLKKWMDRTVPLYPASFLKGKRGSIIAVGAAGRQSIGQAAENVKQFFKIYKVIIDEILLFEGEYPDDVKDNRFYQGKIKEFVDKVIHSLNSSVK